MSRRCYIVTLNWNGWRDTLVCLESIFRVVYDEFVVVVCDNDSTDGSRERIGAWARGDLDVIDDTPAAVRRLTSPPVEKPIPFLALGRGDADRRLDALRSRTLVLIVNGENAGCAAGLNVGVRFSLSQPDCAYVWLLNHDTIVDPMALHHLVRDADRNPTWGLVGSTVRFAYSPTVVQALGGATFNFWLATGYPLGFCQPADRATDPQWVVDRLAYIAGTSMLATRRFVDDVGVLPEHFFLYFEEIAWAMEAKGRFTLGYAPDSLVYHREGAVTGSTTDEPAYGGFADSLILRNRLAFARRYTPWAVPTVCLGLIYVLVESVVLGRWGRVRLLASPSFWFDRPKLAPADRRISRAS